MNLSRIAMKIAGHPDYKELPKEIKKKLIDNLKYYGISEKENKNEEARKKARKDFYRSVINWMEDSGWDGEISNEDIMTFLQNDVKSKPHRQRIIGSDL